MKHYKVEITKEALQDMEDIYNYIAIDLLAPDNAMNFFENTRKPQGFGGKLMTKMMNIGHAKLSQWGFSNISVNPDAAVLDVGCGGGANIIG